MVKIGTDKKRRQSDLMILYGLPGVGKTYLASTIAREYMTLYLDVENSADAIPDEIKESGNIIIEQLEAEALDDIIKIPAAIVDYMKEFTKATKIKFEAIVIDTFSLLGKGLENKAEMTIDDKKKFNYYATLLKYYTDFINEMRKTGKLLILTFHAKQSIVGNTTIVGISHTGTSATDFLAKALYSGFIDYDKIEEKRYIYANRGAYPGNYDLIASKNRVKQYGIPDVIADDDEMYDLSKIYKKILEERKIREEKMNKIKPKIEFKTK